jgi:assimilatory nitrate reductase catalytic subunit
VRLSGDAGQLAAEAWLKEWMLAAEPVAEIRRFLLAPTASAPLGFKALGNIVCTCWNVTDVAINAQLAQLSGPDDARLQALRATLRCGTNCGSCEPALRSMVKDWVSGRAAA